ncbi:uncharacterized [Tachysurus ichikawai]
MGSAAQRRLSCMAWPFQSSQSKKQEPERSVVSEQISRQSYSRERDTKALLMSAGLSESRSLALSLTVSSL